MNDSPGVSSHSLWCSHVGAAPSRPAATCGVEAHLRLRLRLRGPRTAEARRGRANPREGTRPPPRPHLAAEAPPLRAPALRAHPPSPSPSRPRAGGGLAARAGRGSGASRRRERSPRGRLRGLSGRRRRLSRCRCFSRLSRGGRVGGGCGRRRATRRPPAPAGKRARWGARRGWRSEEGCGVAERAAPERRPLGDSTPGRGGLSGHPRARGAAERRAGLRALLMQPEPDSWGGGSGLGAEGGEGGRSWQRAGEVGRPWQREGNSFQITSQCLPRPLGTNLSTQVTPDGHSVPRRGRMQLTNAYC